MNDTDSMVPWWKRAFELLKAAAKEFGEDRCGRIAAAIAYRTIFALAPLLLVAVFVASLVIDEPTADCVPGNFASCETIQERLVGQVEDVAGAQLAGTVDDIMENAKDSRGGTGFLGIGLFLFTASSLFFEIQTGLNQIFDAPEDKTKGIVAMLRARGIGALAVLVVGAILVVLFAANAFVSFAGSFLIEVIDRAGLDGAFFAPLISIGGPLVTLLLLIVVFAVQFQTFTAVRIPWTAAWRGGAVTGLVFAVGAVGVGVYFSFAADGDGGGFSAGGFAGGAVLVLFTVFILAQIYLFGAEFTNVYSGYLRHGDIVQPSVRAETGPPVVTADEARAAATTDLVAKVGVPAFLVGLAIGAFRKR